MALRAGRVGVNPADVNPIDGHIFNSEYSANEKNVGSWIDGSLIYRKSYSIEETTLPTFEWAKVVDGDMNNIKVINSEFAYKTNTGNFNSYPTIVRAASDGLYIMNLRNVPVTAYVGSVVTIYYIKSN